MAATIAKARGYDSSRIKEVHRLGSQASSAEANTWRTFTTTSVTADGSVIQTVVRDGVTVHRFELGPEGDRS